MKIHDIDESPVGDLKRFIHRQAFPGHYDKAANYLYKVLKRKQEENGGNWRHAFGYYAQQIGKSFKGVDTRNLMKIFSQRYGSEFPKLVKEFKIVKPDPKDTMGIKRTEMPQVATKDYPEFMDYLKDNGAEFKNETVPAKSLKAVQGEFSDQGVEKALRKRKLKKASIVSSDNYIIDGHHRWVAALNTGQDVDIIRVNMPAKELLQLVKDFSKTTYKDIYTEGYKLQLERGTDMDVLHIYDTKLKQRTEVRGKPNYEIRHDKNDKLHQLIDKIGKAVNISELMNGEVVSINPNHPQGELAKKLTTKAFNEETLPAKNVMSSELLELDKAFKKKGHELRIVGGAVRDLALGKDPKDIDLATDATPDEMEKVFKKAGIKSVPTGVEHGTITAVINDKPFEITTLRSDQETDGRFAKVQFVKSWEEDAKRRDLTYNAMSMDFEGNLYDYHGGMDDLQDKVSKFVGDPAERIQEDYLRALRYFRFQGRLDNPKFDEDTLNAITANKDGLKKLSVERVWNEVSKILGGNNVKEVLTAMNNTGVSEAIGLKAEIHKDLMDGGDPIINLARITNDSSISSKWKMSNEEKAKLDFLITNKGKKFDKDYYTDSMISGMDRKLLDALARYNNQDDMIQYVSNFEAPEFPVTGNDLIAKGMKSGPELGKTLDALRDKWKQSGYKATKDQLLGENAPGSLAQQINWGGKNKQAKVKQTQNWFQRAKKYVFGEDEEKPHLFLDMDGVQADFFGAWAKYYSEKTGRKITSYRDIGDAEAQLASIMELTNQGPEFVEKFFANLEPLQGFQPVLNWIQQNNIPYSILSAPLRGNNAASIAGKKSWLARHNPGSEKEIFTGRKESYAINKQTQQPNVLIDDHGKYIDRWQGRGGIAIKHTDRNPQATIQALEKIYNNLEEHGFVPMYSTMKAYGMKRKTTKGQKHFVTDDVKYVKPQFDVEWEEANRYSYLDKLGQEGWEELARKGKVITVNKNSVKKIGNTGADGSESLDDLEPDKVARLKKAMDSGTVEMPIVVKQPDGSLDLVAGNTRLIGLINTQGEAKVWLVDASSLNERKLTKGEEKKKEKFVKGMKKSKDDFKKRYGKDAEAVMYATATKMAKNEDKNFGIPDGATLAQLDSIAKNAKSEKKRKRAHWLRNMRRGQNKNK